MKRLEFYTINPEISWEDSKIYIDWFTTGSRRVNIKIFEELYSKDQIRRLLSEPQRREFHFKLNIFGYGFGFILKLNSTGKMMGFYKWA